LLQGATGERVVPPPSAAALRFYDAHFFEVFWYEERYLRDHPAAVHAFGIDRTAMRPAPLEGSAVGLVEGSAEGSAEEELPVEWDLLFIGAFGDHAGHKRPLRIGDRDPALRRAAIGKQDGEEAVRVAAALRAKGVAVLRPLPYAQLAGLIRVRGARELNI